MIKITIPAGFTAEDLVRLREKLKENYKTDMTLEEFISCRYQEKLLDHYSKPNLDYLTGTGAPRPPSDLVEPTGVINEQT